MGNWKLEVSKMAFYILFPVGMFYIFNQPQFFEEYMVDMRKHEKERVDASSREHFREAVKKFQQAKLEKDLQKQWENLK